MKVWSDVLPETFKLVEFNVAMEPDVAVRLVALKAVEVALVSVAFWSEVVPVAVRFVKVALLPVTFASVVCPATARFPPSVVVPETDKLPVADRSKVLMPPSR